MVDKVDLLQRLWYEYCGVLDAVGKAMEDEPINLAIDKALTDNPEVFQLRKELAEAGVDLEGYKK